MWNGRSLSLSCDLPQKLAYTPRCCTATCMAGFVGLIVMYGHCWEGISEPHRWCYTTVGPRAELKTTQIIVRCGMQRENICIPVSIAYM